MPGQRLSYLFEQVFGTPEQYPYVRGFRPAGQPDSALTLLLFVFDSNLPCGAEEHGPGALLQALAQGKIGDAEVSRLIQLSKEAAQNKCVLGLNGKEMKFEPNNTIRVVLLHHHPVAEWKAKKVQLQRSQESWTRWFTSPVAAVIDWWESANEAAMKLVGADEFLEGCFSASIQLILFGHQHNPYRRAVVMEGNAGVTGPFGETKNLRAFCCPTTLAVSEYGNGFYLFDFMDNNNFSMDFYLSRPSEENLPMPFSRIAAKSDVFKLSELSPEELESAYTAPPPLVLRPNSEV